MKHLMAVAALLVAGNQVGAQTVPSICACPGGKTPLICPIGKTDCAEVKVIELDSGECQASFVSDYCLLCVIRDGSTERSINWKFASGTDPKYLFLTSPEGIKISPMPEVPAEFYNPVDADARRTFWWTITANSSPQPRPHFAQVTDGTQTCSWTSSYVVNTN